MSIFFSKIIAFAMALIMTIATWLGIDVTGVYKLASPQAGSEISQEETGLIDNADFYVSVNGNDSADGSLAHPFATLQKAIEVVRGLDKSELDGITVAVMAGDYSIKNIEFTQDDSGTADCPIVYCAYGDGEVIINGGITLSPDKFTHITDETVLNRLGDKAKKNVLCYDLSRDGITSEDYGKIYAIGKYNTANKYSGETEGPVYCELFVNDERMTLSRYPNEGWLESDEPIEVGQGREYIDSHVDNPWWSTIVDPNGDTYSVNKKLANRINSWQTLDDVWVFGYPAYDWADASSPIESFDYENRTLKPKYVSLFGVTEGAPYYFFNVFEELDSVNEWYLDRENAILYLYPDEDFANSEISLCLSNKDIFSGSDVEYVTFDGFTFKGTRSDAINITGNNITIQNCLIKNVSGNAIQLNGYNNLVTKCEITKTGKGGIILDGGDRETLTPGNSKADNNLIHDWGEIFQTYQPAVYLYGVGNSCTHNEIYNYTHEAISYAGNNHLIEYNLIHDVCLTSSDAGAIYSGRRWDWYGTVIRYNCIYDLGNGEYKPDAIYFDDAISGQTCYGNLLVNIPRNGIHIGGGRDMIVKNNVIINAGTSIYYDIRAREGAEGGWFTHTWNLEGDMWVNLFESPWQNEYWQKAFPQMTLFSSDYDNMDDPNFVPNPSYSEVTGNLIVSLDGTIGDVFSEVEEYSTISDNAIYKLLKADKIFTDYVNGDYSIKENSTVYDLLPDFETIPVSEIGRY